MAKSILSFRLATALALPATTLALLATPGCATEVSRGDRIERAPLPKIEGGGPRISSLESDADFKPGLYVDEAGRRWMRRRIIKKSELGTLTPQSTEYAVEDDSPEAMSPRWGSVQPVTPIDPLAEPDLRAVTRVGNIEYREMEPSPKAQAALAYARQFQRARMSRTHPGKLEAIDSNHSAAAIDNSFGTSTPAAEPIQFSTLTTDANVVDPDDRSYILPGDRWATRNAYQFRLGSCSGTLISRRVAVMAAHCFWKASTGYAMYPQLWKMGLVTHRPSQYVGFNEYTTYPVYNGCYTYYFPTAWIDSGGSSREYDYAMVEFTCGINPGDTVGWAWLAWGDNGDYYTANTTQFNAYDGVPQHPWGYQSPLGQGWNVPSLITRTYGPYVASVAAGYLLRVYIDATAGSSGGGLLQQLYTTYGDFIYYYTGSMSGKDIAADQFVYFRRMEAVEYAFLAAYNTEW